jgi:hypothetical protein
MVILDEISTCLWGQRWGWQLASVGHFAAIKPSSKDKTEKIPSDRLDRIRVTD